MKKNKLNEILKLARNEIYPIKGLKAIARSYVIWSIFAFFFLGSFFGTYFATINKLEIKYILIYCFCYISLWTTLLVLTFLRIYSREKAIYYFDYDLYRSIKFIRLNFKIRLAFDYLKEVDEQLLTLKKTEFSSSKEKLFYSFFDNFNIDGLKHIFDRHFEAKKQSINKIMIWKILLNEFNLRRVTYDALAIFISKNQSFIKNWINKNIKIEKEINFKDVSLLNDELYSVFILFKNKEALIQDKNNKEAKKGYLINLFTSILSFLWYASLVFAMTSALAFEKEAPSFLIRYKESFNDAFTFLTLVCYALLILCNTFIIYSFIFNVKNHKFDKKNLIFSSISLAIILIVSVFAIFWNEYTAYYAYEKDYFLLKILLMVATVLFGFYASIVLFIPNISLCLRFKQDRRITKAQLINII
ncbi:hypothetical protein [Metamycoplasma neophronis]|uniref:Uncharacterized protein n=1 Tax=Metamycoplasma neophronis TaxID=872983 RepID=A0ABY2YZH6_9BACT|nr:hypothetical protein [Metamycoplasma neophronis]TPR53542.1 hypothetical protein FJR74_02530 [Metamycoplasma neophronis]